MQISLPLPEWALALHTDAVPSELCAYLELAEPATLLVEFHYAPGSPGFRYYPNGDPGEPPEPDELELYHVTCPHGLVLASEGIRLEFAPGFDILDFLSKTWSESLELDLLAALDHHHGDEP